MRKLQWRHLVLALCAAAAAVAGIEAGFARGSPPPEAPHSDGSALFTAKCAICHGADGTPKLVFRQKGAPNMKDPEWQKSRTDGQLRQTIAEGKGSSMVAYKEKLSAAEIDALVSRIRAFASPVGNQKEPESPEAAKKQDQETGKEP